MLERGVDLFNRRMFYEAHDVWEDAWREESGDTRVMLQGLIQIAAGFVKLQRGKPAGTVELLEKGAEKLARIKPVPVIADLEALLKSAADWRDAAGRMAMDNQTEFDPEALPRLALCEQPPG
jgi:predicted metal-dependent hydrolase